MRLTWRSLAYRTLWELDRRSGFKAMRTPRGSVPIPASTPTQADWLAELGGGHRLRRLTPGNTAPLRGRGRAPGDPDWHLEPGSGRRWPARVHWTQAMDAAAGDVRLTWETNRFGWVWSWLADGANAATEFAEQLADWRHHNPFRSGVNWASGQELAVRSLAWLGGAAVWGDQLDDAAWRDLVELLYWHGVQIEAEWGFAQHAVRNNHVIAEALGLAAIGDAFAGFEESDRWRALGLAAIEEAAAEQFFDDGGYCQHSHGYHHFALQLLLEAWEWFDELHGVLRPVFERSVRYFEALLEPGGLPNFGPNDRAEVPDYAGLLDELRARTDLDARPAPASASFGEAGLHVMRRGGFTATLRCGELPDRAGHDDGLHVEVWLDGEPLTADAGSYRYGGPEHEWFAGARSHNVCLVGDREPRSLLTTFTWDRVVAPQLEELNERRGLMRAQYDAAYPGIARWERRIELDDDAIEVVDLLNAVPGTGPHTFRLHWLLELALCGPAARGPDAQMRTAGRRPAPAGAADAPMRTAGRRPAPGDATEVLLIASDARITIVAEPLIGELQSFDETTSAAWVSRAYGKKELATSMMVSARGQAVRFRTRFERL